MLMLTTTALLVLDTLKSDVGVRVTIAVVVAGGVKTISVVLMTLLLLIISLLIGDDAAKVINV